MCWMLLTCVCCIVRWEMNRTISMIWDRSWQGWFPGEWITLKSCARFWKRFGSHPSKSNRLSKTIRSRKWSNHSRSPYKKLKNKSHYQRVHWLMSMKLRWKKLQLKIKSYYNSQTQWRSLLKKSRFKNNKKFAHQMNSNEKKSVICKKFCWIKFSWICHKYWNKLRPSKICLSCPKKHLKLFLGILLHVSLSMRCFRRLLRDWTSIQNSRRNLKK